MIDHDGYTPTTSDAIMIARTGSVLYGTAVSDKPDIDLLGICIPPPEVTLGLGSPFHTYVWKEAGEGNRTGPGQTDLKIYSLHRYLQLIASSDFTATSLLFVPQDYTARSSAIWESLVSQRDRLISREKVGARALSYLSAQVKRYLIATGKNSTRPELIERYGWDTKAGYHALRIAKQTQELLITGDITLPMAETDREYLIKVRQGIYRKVEVLDSLVAYRDQIINRLTTLDEPKETDYSFLNSLNVSLTFRHWGMTNPHGNTLDGWDPTPVDSL